MPTARGGSSGANSSCTTTGWRRTTARRSAEASTAGAAAAGARARRSASASDAARRAATTPSAADSGAESAACSSLPARRATERVRPQRTKPGGSGSARCAPPPLRSARARRRRRSAGSGCSASTASGRPASSFADGSPNYAASSETSSTSSSPTRLTCYSRRESGTNASERGADLSAQTSKAVPRTRVTTPPRLRRPGARGSWAGRTTSGSTGRSAQARKEMQARAPRAAPRMPQPRQRCGPPRGTDGSSLWRASTR
mmetsp:Transcript_232/g.994  ORF Transcript_232/g.994 Transcript_232/m.994 type:complete len:258 (+) Transcript_232:849-1622(+)